MEDETIPSGEVDGEPESTDDVTIPDATEPEESEVDTDERGIPVKNLYAEFNRKLARLEKKFTAQLETKDRVINSKDRVIDDLMQTVARVQTPAPVQEEKRWTREELLDAYAKAAGDPATQAQVMDELTNLKMREATTAATQAAALQQVQAQYAQRALQEFPELHDQSSEFYRQVAYALEQRRRENLMTQRSVYDAACEVAAKRPDLVKREKARPTSGRGFSEPGSGRPVKQEEGKVEIDPKLFARYKSEYPQITEASIKRRQAQIQKRLVWGKE